MGFFNIFTRQDRSARGRTVYAPSHTRKVTQHRQDHVVDPTRARSRQNNSPPPCKDDTSQSHPSPSRRRRTAKHHTTPKSEPSVKDSKTRNGRQRVRRTDYRSHCSPITKRANENDTEVSKIQPHANNTQKPWPSNVETPSKHLVGCNLSDATEPKRTNPPQYYPSKQSDPVANHPAYRPPLPPRPREQVPQWANARSVESKDSFDASLSSRSVKSTSSSSCRTSTSTEATTTVPEETIPLNPEQEMLRRLASVGFAHEGENEYPTFGNANSFAVSKKTSGCISPKVQSVLRQRKLIIYPRSTTVSAIVRFEAQDRSELDEDTTRVILRQLLLSDEIQRADLPYVLPCFYWIKTHLESPTPRVRPFLRLQCNVRQRKLFQMFEQISSLKDDAELARMLTGIDVYDNSLRLCAFLELSIERCGPFHVRDLLDSILNGRKRLDYGDLKLDHLNKASPDSIANVVATIVHSLGQHLATSGCHAHQMQAVADGLSLVLVLSGETGLAKVFHAVSPKLMAGEVTLCYSLLLATGLGRLADETEEEGLWCSLVRRVNADFKLPQDDISMVISAIVVLIYSGGEGTRALFPCMYGEVLRRDVRSHARRAWELLGGDVQVWDAVSIEAERQWKSQNDRWDNREALIEAAWRQQMEREAIGSL